MAMQVVVTRPAREAAAWVAALLAGGFDPVALPLLAFGPPAHADLLAAARLGVAGFDAVMFVSPQAVHAFLGDGFDKKSDSSLSGIDLFAINDDLRRGPLRCWAPGPGTAQALVRAGVPLARIDQPVADAAQFDSEALWAVVAPQVAAGSRVLVVRGELDTPAGLPAGGQGSGREWLADQCRAAGAAVQMCAAYRRQTPFWTPDMCAAARNAATNGAVWLFSSSEGVAHLAKLLPGQCWGEAIALTTHPRIAQAVSGLGFGQVQVCRPAQADVLQTLNNWPTSVPNSGQPGPLTPKMARTP
ncbi:MAG: uroporphyrinogen-III synthase [Burkholderiales bacterium]|nr:uroporphyrinogen-III synthase [Burkholderiales bacterium]